MKMYPHYTTRIAQKPYVRRVVLGLAALLDNQQRHRRKFMRPAVLVATFACWGGLLLLCLMGLTLVWLGEVNTFVLPDATGAQIQYSRLSQQHITYRLSPNQTQDYLHRQLVQNGWTRDVRDERSLRGHIGDRLAVFWRQNWFGLVPEVVVIRQETRDQRRVDIDLSRCLAIRSWMRCL